MMTQMIQRVVVRTEGARRKTGTPLTEVWNAAPDERAGESLGSLSWHGFPWKPTLRICLVTLIGAYFFYTVQFEVPTILPLYGVTDPAAIGATAAQLLFGRIAGDTSPPREVMLLTRLVIRGSGEIAPAVS